MKIAVTYENGDVFQHFGHTEQFKVYEVENNTVTASTLVNTNGSGHGALADVLKQLSVDTLICGGIGGGAQSALKERGIHLFGGVTGNADYAVDALLSGSLSYKADISCDHHHDDHHHSSHHHGDCGNHGCGEHCHSN